MKPPSGKTSTRTKGAAAEAFARRLLEEAGYRVVEMNARTPRWELDVIAWDEDTLCFIEVRSTKDLAFGGPLATVGADKRRRVVRGARAWLAHHETAPPARPWPPAVRFDVLGIWGEDGARQHELVRGAFDAGG